MRTLARQLVHLIGGHASVAVDHHAYIADLERFVDELDELLLQKADNDP